MAIEPELAALMHQTVQIARRTGQTKNGEWQFAASVTSIPCRIDYIQRVQQMPTISSATRAGGSVLDRVFVMGVQIQFADIVYTLPGVKLAMGDQVTLPDGNVLQIQEVHHYDDDVGPYFTELIA